MNVQTNKEKGFTIIEVVLVLAIAALIFLMVFIALPALQRSQRDTARKNDVGVVVAAVNTYTSGNKGLFPTTANLTPYVAGETSDNSPTVTSVLGTAATAGAKTAVDGTITVYQGLKCGTLATNKATLVKGTKTQYAVITLLEAGGATGTAYCEGS